MGRPRVQVFHPGEMPLVVLSILDERSHNGHELMVALARRVPTYRPSAGSIYPALGALRSEGLIEVDESGRRGAYRLTAAGTALLASKQQLLGDVMGRVGGVFPPVEDPLRPVLERFVSRIAATAPRSDVRHVERILHRAALAIERLER